MDVEMAILEDSPERLHIALVKPELEGPARTLHVIWEAEASALRSFAPATLHIGGDAYPVSDATGVVLSQSRAGLEAGFVVLVRTPARDVRVAALGGEQGVATGLAKRLAARMDVELIWTRR